MSDELDDTVITPPRAPSAHAIEPDFDDTIVAGVSRAAAPVAPVTQPVPVEATPADISSYYSVSIGTHPDSIMLNVPCYIGRRPSPPRVTRGEVPRLIRVPSPLKEVSSTHLEVRQLGSSVIVTDLRSTNGSIVMVPGSVPRKLRQGESVVVSPGTLVDIGDGNVLHILPIQRLAAGSQGRQS